MSYYDSYTDEEFDNLVIKFYKIVFPNGDIDFTKSLWRLSQGCREHAIYVLKTLGYQYNIYVDDILFDNVCALANGGVEVEWLTENWAELSDENQHKRFYDYTINNYREDLIKIEQHFNIK